MNEHLLCTMQDVLDARKMISPYLTPTPFQQVEELSSRLGAQVWVKYENLQPVRAFKVRGGINLVGRLSPSEREAGVITASTGNHGQAIAYAGRLFGVRVVVAAPQNPNPLKIAAIRSLGAEVVEVGSDLDEARDWAEETAERNGMRFVASAEPLIIAGAGTMALEMLEHVPDLDIIITPIGGGSGACGHCIVGKTLNPRLQVIGVQAAGCPAYWRAYHEGRMDPVERVATFAEGLAVRTPAALPVAILRRHLDDLVLVSDEEIRQAMVALIMTTGMLAEGAGAASTAAAFKLKESLRGKKVGLVLSGANLTFDSLKETLTTVEYV